MEGVAMARVRRTASLLAFALRSPALLAAALVLCGLWLWPLTLGFGVPVPGDPAFMASLEGVAGQAVHTAGLDEGQAAYMARWAEAAADVLEAPDEASMVRAYAAYERVEGEAGRYRFSSTEPAYQREARLELWEAVAALPDGSARAFRSVGEYPALLYVSWAAALLPPWAWCLPALAAAWSAARLVAGRPGLLRRRPASPAGGFLSAAAVGSVAAVVAALASAVPAFVLAAARNGVGDGAYPVVNTVGSEVVATTVGASLAATFGSWAPVCLFLCTLGVAGASLSRSRAVGVFVAAVCALAPEVLAGAGGGSQPEAPTLWAPTTYLRPPAHCGRFTYSAIVDFSYAGPFGESVSLLPRAVEGAGPAVASAVLALWSALAAAMGAVARAVRAPRPSRGAAPVAGAAS